MIVNNTSLEALFAQSEDAFFEAISLETLTPFLKDKFYFTGINTPNLNPFFVHQQITDEKIFASKIKELFAQKNNCAMLIIPDSLCSDALMDELSSQNFILEEISTAMFLDLRTIKPDEALSDNIKLMNNNMDLWLEPVKSGFEATTQEAQDYRMALLRKPSENFLHFSLFEDDQVVSSITLSFYKNACRIDNVVTKKSHQQKGFGTKLMRFALNFAKNKNADFCFLEAAAKGLSLYQKQGFQKLFEYKNFIPNHSLT